MTTFTETLHPGAFIVSEGQGFYSRDVGTIALNQTILVGQVLGKTAVVAAMTASAAAVAGGTGNGTITLASPALSGKAKDGKYRATCVEAAANGGKFRVEDPLGVEIGLALVGVAFTKEIKFTIADGSTDFVTGDAFEITVGRETGTDEQYKALDLAATDGSDEAVAIAVYPAVTDGSNTAKISVLTRHAEVRASDLTWPAGITAPQQAAAIEQLRRIGIKLR